MTTLDFSLMLSLGLVSGMHCLGMCGPIVLAYSLPLGRRGVWRAHLSYNAGRILTYMLLGALAGAAGGGLGVLGRMAGLATGARIFAGAAMIVAAVCMIGFGPSSGLITIRKGGIAGRFHRAAGRLLLASREKFTLGLLLGFLPCGLVYAALLKAMESAGALSGALTMLAFGLGTAVALLAAGAVSSLAAVRVGRWSNRLAAVSIAIAGAVLLWRGLAAPHCHG
ncbi:MAG TPA: sulfite exporter TauE/SafE family protein [Bryobacteraceae bacterium]|nr:sulfite exporter TauE/SafE family protein [Bryobacteraceae bacterium]